MKAHRTDLLSLIFGLGFVFVASGFLLDAYSNLKLPDVGWFVAGGLILVGVVTAIGALIPSREPKEPVAPEATDEVLQP